MNEQTKPAKRANTSIFTKRKVHELLRNLTDEIRGLKSSRAIVDHLEATTKRYVPSGRGRQPGAAVDYATLQAIVDDTAETAGSFDAGYVLGLSASKWNCRDGYTGTLMDKTKLRKYVEKNKISLPAGISLVTRKRRTTQTVEQMPDGSSTN